MEHDDIANSHAEGREGKAQSAAEEMSRSRGGEEGDRDSLDIDPWSDISGGRVMRGRELELELLAAGELSGLARP